MIEIRELVIRATVENGSSQNNQNNENEEQTRIEGNDCCQDNIDMILKIIKDKKER